MKRGVGFFVYVAFGLALNGLYALAEASGVGRPTPVLHSVVSQPTVRQPPGGGVSGSGSFWHSGSHGGK